MRRSISESFGCPESAALVVATHRLPFPIRPTRSGSRAAAFSAALSDPHGLAEADDPAMLEKVLTELVGQRILYTERGKYFTLALPANTHH